MPTTIAIEPATLTTENGQSVRVDDVMLNKAMDAFALQHKDKVSRRELAQLVLSRVTESGDRSSAENWVESIVAVTDELKAAPSYSDLRQADSGFALSNGQVPPAATEQRDTSQLRLSGSAESLDAAYARLSRDSVAGKFFSTKTPVGSDAEREIMERNSELFGMSADADAEPATSSDDAESEIIQRHAHLFKSSV